MYSRIASLSIPYCKKSEKTFRAENPRESEPLARVPTDETRFSTSSSPVEASPIAQPERLFGQAVMRL
jgi:hypothetical protein